MKQLLLLSLLLLFFLRQGNAQYLFTIAELIEIAETRDRQSLDALMKSKKFAFHKKRTEKGETDYSYLDRNPSGSELIGKVNVIPTPGIASNAIALNTGAGNFQYHMKNEVEKEGFTLEETKANGDKQYSKVIGSKKWYLTVRVPQVEPRATVHMATIYAMPYKEKAQPAGKQSSLPVAETKPAPQKAPDPSRAADLPPTLKTRTISPVGKPGYSPFPVKITESRYHRLSAQGDTIARAEAIFSYPEFPDETLNDLLRQRIAGSRSYEMEALAITNGHKAAVSGFKDEEIGATMGREDRTDRAAVRGITSRLYLLENNHYSYGAGAAHGQNSVHYWAYDIEKRTFLGLPDLFTVSGLEALKTLAEKEFRKNEGLSAAASLCEKYLFDKCKFHLPTNLRFDPQSVSLVYNPYEAKSFADGIWEIRLNYQQVLPLMKPEYAAAIRGLISSTVATASKPKAVETPARAEEKPVKTTHLLGGNTPEELGKILLKALQNNDIDTWKRCIHPEREESNQQLIMKRFRDVIDRLEQHGLTDWSAVRFSRVMFERNDNNNRKVASAFTIEFTYKQDFIGHIWFWSVATFQHQNTYFIWGQPDMDNTFLIRKDQMKF